jgi:hypothetical protein
MIADFVAGLFLLMPKSEFGRTIRETESPQLLSAPTEPRRVCRTLHHGAKAGAQADAHNPTRQVRKFVLGPRITFVPDHFECSPVKATHYSCRLA